MPRVIHSVSLRSVSLRSVSLVGVGLLGIVVLSGCVANDPASTHTALTVDSSATGCAVSANEAPAGSIRFTVANSGDQVTEFYLLAEDGLRIVGEAENIGPGLSRDLVVQLEAGSYFTACKPGMTGDGVGKTEFTATKTDAAATVNSNLASHIDTITTNYGSSVRNQID
ncbi:cupredoxin domain-containing protein [Cryobacterium sp. Y11]|uniref:cupredoxin domain-containing protein n=1 Tax=Cryobacterium sp. Y11 TaxID=2045016 RepID=UPI001E532139|nr:cupredoxin domain-containing protein [Cryobacterium sp. Y11]